MLKNKCIATLCMAFIAGLYSIAFGDTIYLEDGTMLVGKVILKKPTYIVFANSFGTFTIETVKLIEMKITETYTEDIKEYKRLGKEINVDDIKKNFQAGENLLDKIILSDKKIDDVSAQKEIKSGPLPDHGRLGIGLGYISTSLSIFSDTLNTHDVIPNGIYMNFTYDFNLEKFIKKSNMGIPCIKFELLGMYFSHELFTNNKLQLSGLSILGGFMWALPSLNNRWGAITLTGLPGVSFLCVANDYIGLTKWIYPFTIALDLGYEFSFGIPSIFLRLRYLFINDADIGFHSIGVNIGASFKI